MIHYTKRSLKDAIKSESAYDLKSMGYDPRAMGSLGEKDLDKKSYDNGDKRAFGRIKTEAVDVSSISKRHFLFKCEMLYNFIILR